MSAEAGIVLDFLAVREMRPPPLISLKASRTREVIVPLY